MNRLLTAVIFILPSVLFGQGKGIPVKISLFNESTAIPFTKFLTTPIHPGFQLGTEFNYRNKERSRFFQTANLCYFYHNYLAQGIGLNSAFGYEYRLNFGVAFAGLLGIGYMHTFATTEEFILLKGQYEKKTDKGNARFFPSFSLDISYYLKREKSNGPAIFIRYQSWAEYPYSPDFIPVMTHINLHTGAKFFIHKKIKTND